MHEENIFTIWNHVHIFLFTICISGALRGQKNAPDLQDLKIQNLGTQEKQWYRVNYPGPKYVIIILKVKSCSAPSVSYHLNVRKVPLDGCLRTQWISIPL